MKLSRYLASLSLCLLLIASSNAYSQAKMDADDSDVAALEQKIAYAHKEKIPALEGKPGFFKACRSGKPNTSDQDASAACATASEWSTNPSNAKEQILLKGCSYQHSGNPAWNACFVLAEYYVDAGRDIEALATLKVPNAINNDQPDASDRKMAGIRYGAYKALGNEEMAREELHNLCYNLGGGGTYTGQGGFGDNSCGLLVRLGESVDADATRQRMQVWDADRRVEAHQRQADEAEEKAEKAERQQQIVGLVNGLADTAVSSYQQSQADMAQARVNATAIRLAQENKNRGPGGYSTTSSSGGSSGSGTSSTSSTHSAAKSTATASDSSDSTSSDSSSDSSTAASSSGNSFNAYSSTGGGYNPYSGQGGSSGGASTSGESGQWITTEITVTCMSRSVPHAFITAVLVSSPGNPNCNGALIEFTNPDKTHPFYYGFAGVANEQMEANTTKALSWGAPYLYKDMPNPPFAARVTIKYFAVY